MAVGGQEPHAPMPPTMRCGTGPTNPGALRTDTKRIVTKLDVTIRAAAVRRARDQGLI